MTPLTRDDATARAALLDIESYSVDLDLRAAEDPQRDTFDSVTRLRFTAREAGRTFVDVRPRSLRSATLDGESLDVSRDLDPDAGRLLLDVRPGDHELLVDAEMAYSVDGEGLHRHFDPADGRTYLYAMSFLDAAPRWFACVDQPDLKAPFELSVRCPAGWTVAGNGPAESTAPGQWRLVQPRPVATYFTTLVAGPYHSVRDEHDGIPLAIHARASLSDELDRDAADLFAHTARCLDEFHRLFGSRYPWGEYHQAFVPEFNAGAMENPGCVTFRDQMLFRSRATTAELVDRANTIAHEMAHMWFGDLVTMRWWDDLWLNESFAEYLGARVSAAVGNPSAWVAFGIERKSWGHDADRRPSTHPVAGNGAADSAAALNDFDGISYAKGAAVLRQLATRLGDDVFLTGLRAHIGDHAFGNAELADLLAAWERAGAVDLDGWTSGWLRTAGMDTLRVAGDTLEREAPERYPADREHAITVASFAPDGTELARAPMLLRGSAPLPVSRGAVTVPDADDQSWATVALSPTDWEALTTALPGLPDITRVVVWNALRDAVADAAVDPAVAVELVTGCATGESDAVLGELFPWLTGPVLGAYLDPAGRPAARRRIAAAARSTAAGAGDDPGRRLAAARAFVATAEPDELEALLTEGNVLGVELDRDLRWRVTAALARAGATDLGAIEAAAAADRSAEGAQRAAYSRAALPDAEAKRAAWQALTEPGAMSNALLYETAQGFWQPSQVELTADYVARWFDEIPPTARFRSGWVVGRLAAQSFPWTAVDADTVRRAEALSVRDDVASGVRRAVVDRGDDLRRALASRRRFAAGRD